MAKRALECETSVDTTDKQPLWQAKPKIPVIVEKLYSMLISPYHAGYDMLNNSI